MNICNLPFNKLIGLEMAEPENDLMVSLSDELDSRGRLLAAIPVEVIDSTGKVVLSATAE